MGYYYNLFLDPCGFPHQTTSQCVYLGVQTFCIWVVVVLAAYIVGYLLWRIIKHHTTTEEHVLTHPWVNRKIQTHVGRVFDM